MDTPQFKTAEYSATKAPDPCKICGQPIGPLYYRVNGEIACATCAAKAKSETPNASHAAFVRGILFGIGGAIVGLIIYATFAIVTGLVIGYVSLAVGWIVGKAIKLGSKGFGGGRYQIAAVALTYAAVSMAAVPISINAMMKQQQRHAQMQSASSSTDSSNASNSAPDMPASNVGDSSQAPSQAPMGAGAAIVALIFAGLASPFLELMHDPFHGGIGLVILLVGIRIAWQLTAGDDHAQVVGPFKNPAAAAPPSLG